MKYKKGCMVEVLMKDNFGNDSWRCAQIVSGNGLSYIVSYNVYHILAGFTNNADVERVSMEYVRPCPPLSETTKSRDHGDVVEVFHNFSWKMAIVLKDFKCEYCLVRLVGSFQEFEVTKSELRDRQSYKNDEWIIIDKVPTDYKNVNSAKLLESPIISCRMRKRSSPCSYLQDEVNEKRARRTLTEMVALVASKLEITTLEDDETYTSILSDQSPTHVELADRMQSLKLNACRSNMEAFMHQDPLLGRKNRC